MGSQAPPFSLFLVSIALFSLHCVQMVSCEAEASTKLYIVYLGEKEHDDPKLVTASHHQMLTSLLGSKAKAKSSIVYSYKHGFSGFAAMLTEAQAKQIADFPGVISVKPNWTHKLHTTRSWDFLGVTYDPPSALLRAANSGEGMIIGVIDSGIWPESRSFSGEGYGPIPSRWKGRCQTGQAFGANNCSRKLIGARYYTGGVDPDDLKLDYHSPRGVGNHGTHTASTAGGNIVPNVSVNGLAAGAARGGAHRARIAAYKVCWGPGGRCSGAAELKAVDDAIADGVDVMSLSLGSVFADADFPVSIHAVAKGIPLVFSGGNDGPTPQTVAPSSPWVITVAASTIDRAYPSVITLGDNTKLIGQSIFPGSKVDKFRELATNHMY